MKRFLLTLLCVTATLQAFGQADTVQIDEVKVTASRASLSADRLVRTVTLFDKESIKMIPVNTVNDLLKWMPGVDVRQRGDQGMQTDISIRGGTSDQISLLIDGVNICDPQTGHNAFSIPLEINDIERIEVLEGPAARAYGSSSLTGAVNIITKKEKNSGVEARLEGGSYGYVDAGLRLDLVTGKVRNSISGGYGRSDGSSRSAAGNLNADWQSGRLFYRGSWAMDDADLGWHFGFMDKDFGANTFYSIRSDEQFEHVRKYFVAFQAKTKGKTWQFMPKIYWNRSEDRFEFFKGSPDRSPYNHHRSDVFGLDLNNEVNWLLGKTSLGAEFRNEGIISTNLGEQLATDGLSRNPVYQKGLNRTNISFFLDHTVLLKAVTISAGVAAVRNTGNEKKFRFYPGADISWKFGKGWNLYGSWNTSLRMPTFTELYYSVGGHLADKNLAPEQMQSAEIGLRYDHQGIYGRLDVWYSYGSDLIDWIRDISEGEDAPWRSVNHGAVNSVGVSPYLRIDFNRLLKRDFFIRTLDLSYNYIWQDMKTTENIQSKYVLEYLRNKFVAKMDFNLWKNLNLSISCRVQDRVGNYQKDGELVAYVPYCLLDAQLSWDEENYRIFLSGNNLTDRTYYDYGNIPQPGFWFRVGAVYRFAF